MIKIDLNKKILDKHLAYFNEKVGEKLNYDESNSKWKSFFANNHKLGSLDEIKLNFPNQYRAFVEFLRFCHKNKQLIAIEKLDELRRLQPKLESGMEKFSDIPLLMKAVEFVFNYDSFSTLNNSVRKMLQTDKRVDEMQWCAYTLVVMLGLRVCPYCNEQYITPTVTKQGCLRGDLDHFISKKKHPYFALSIYNLVPCCKFCNSSLKGEKEFLNDRTATPYEISYNDCFTFKAIETDGKWRISIDDNNQKKDPEMVREILEMFLIEKRYLHHTDVVIDYLQKDRYYNKYKIERMLQKYPDDVYPFLSCYFGYPLDEKAINDNVLNKLKRDLAKGLLHHDFFM